MVSLQSHHSRHRNWILRVSWPTKLSENDCTLSSMRNPVSTNKVEKKSRKTPHSTCVLYIYKHRHSCAYRMWTWIHTHVHHHRQTNENIILLSSPMDGSLITSACLVSSGIRKPSLSWCLFRLGISLVFSVDLTLVNNDAGYYCTSLLVLIHLYEVSVWIFVYLYFVFFMCCWLVSEEWIIYIPQLLLVRLFLVIYLKAGILNKTKSVLFFILWSLCVFSKKYVLSLMSQDYKYILF